MKKVAINISYDDRSYTSDYKQLTDNELSELHNLCEKAIEGKLTYMQIYSENKEYFFPKNILERSVISLVYSSVG